MTRWKQGRRYVVYPAVQWVDDGIEYLLKSDAVEVDRLLEIAKSMR